MSSGCFNGICTKWTIGNEVRDILISNDDIYAAVGEDIFPIVAPENVDDPFIVYYREKYHRQDSKIGYFEDECHIVLTIVSTDYDLGANIAGLVDSALSGPHTIGECKYDFQLYDASEGFEDLKYFQQLVYSVK